MQRLYPTVLAFIAVMLEGSFACAQQQGQRNGGETNSADAMQTQQPKMADAFVDSIGVNTHMRYSPGPYTQLAKVKAALLEAGIRHVRDYPVNQRALAELGRAGIKTSAIIGHPGQGGWALPFDRYWSTVEKLAPYLSSIEGTNEPDLTMQENWPELMREHQKRIWNAAKANPRLHHIPIAGPSLTWPQDVAEDLGDISQHVDWGNAHPYPGGAPPEHHRVVGDMAATKQHNVAGKPVVMTETGYHNATDGDSGHLPASEQAAATYLPRLFLHYFNLGVPRTFAYEFIDEGTDNSDLESRFGMLRNDFSRKPAFEAIKNLTALLQDRGAAFRPTSLTYDLVGANEQTETTLLQKRDGTLWLAVWQGTSVWDNQSRRPQSPADVPLTLRLAHPAGRILAYMPNRRVDPIQTNTGTSLRFTSSEEVTLIEIRVSMSSEC